MKFRLCLKKFVLLFTICLGAVALCDEKEPLPIRDGFMLNGVDGAVTIDQANDICWFSADAAITDDKGIIEAEKKVAILRCSNLEKLMSQHDGGEFKYRIWGTVSRYGEENLVYLLYFLPLEKPTRVEEADKVTDANSADEGEAEESVVSNDADDALQVPAEILEKMQKRKVITTGQLRKGVEMEIEEDSILSHRTGYMEKRGEGKVFVLDGLGRNVNDVSFRLLPCEVLSVMEEIEAAALNNVRFDVAGIVTRYKGVNYLLLQRVMRIYNYQNFGR